jgi:hypothetical protein
MRCFRAAVCAVTCLSVPAAHGGVSPAESPLLALVPAGAQIIAGIEDPHNAGSHGRLLLATHNNSLDYIDFLSLTGVDPQRNVEKVVEAAASSPRGELAEHLLLMSGRFDRDHVVAAALRNGAGADACEGVGILAVQPFARESKVMHDTRWLAILDGEIALFGTPWMVKEALRRYLDHETADPELAGMMARLHAGVESWSIMAMPPEMLMRHLSAWVAGLSWARFFDGADQLALGIHYGWKARIDFAIHETDEQRALDAAATLQGPHLLETSPGTKLQVHLVHTMVEQGVLTGSITLSGDELDACMNWLNQTHGSSGPR